MVIETLKAEIAALNEAMKEKGVPEKVLKTLKESASGLQKLLDKAREAAKAQESETPAEEETAAESVDPHKVAPGHKMTHTTTVKHEAIGDKDGEEEGDEPEPKDGDKDKMDDAEESRKVHLEMLLKEAAIPATACKVEDLMKLSLKEAKAAIAEKKAMIESIKKSMEESGDEFVPTGTGPLSESDHGENLNSLFTGCAQ